VIDVPNLCSLPTNSQNWKSSKKFKSTKHKMMVQEKMIDANSTASLFSSAFLNLSVNSKR